MTKKERDLGQQWRAILVSLVYLQKNWKKFTEKVLETGRDEVAELPLEAQRAVAKWGRASFSKALPPMIGHLRATGGILEHLKEMQKQEQEKEKLKGEKKDD